MALKEEADPALEREVDECHWVRLGQLGRLIRVFRDRGIREAVMAGQVRHVRLFGSARPDLRALALLAKTRDTRAESVLGAVADELESEGIRLLPSTTYLDENLPRSGTLTRGRPTAAEEKDIRVGISVARALAGADVGQTVVVKGGAVIAVEAMEGTDACIRRGAQVAGSGVVVVKVARPNQDPRFDVPVIGVETVRTLSEVRARVLAVEAGKTLLLDLKAVVREAERAGIGLVAVG